MSKKLSNDYRLWVESATPGTYNMVKGNQQLSISRSGNAFSTGSKDDYPYDPQAPGTRSVSVTASFVPDLPDATGYTRLAGFLSSASASAVNIQIRKGGASGADPGDVVFACSVYVTQQNTDMGMNSPVTAPFTLVAAAAPTTDLLA